MIICAPGPLDRENAILGTTTDVCAECGTEICVAPTGRKLASEQPQPVRLICVACGLAMLAQDPDTTLMPLQPEQLDELAKNRERRR
jgi:hypothetical protein